jgi:hypothetical protein
MTDDEVAAWLIAAALGLPGLVLLLGEVLPAAAWAVLVLAEWAGVA